LRRIQAQIHPREFIDQTAEFAAASRCKAAKIAGCMHAKSERRRAL
jgi:hypothetical protein